MIEQQKSFTDSLITHLALDFLLLCRRFPPFETPRPKSFFTPFRNKIQKNYIYI